MKPPAESKIDFSVFTGPYPVFALGLVVIEALLGYWLYRSENGAERGITGLVMLSALFGLLYALNLNKRIEADVQALAQSMTTIIKPPEGQITEKEIASSAPNQVVSPDRSYIINHPPDGWRVREMSQSEWASEGLGIKDPAARESMFPTSPNQNSDILVFEREKQISISPVPGRTTINGRMIPTALETQVPIQLAIVPIERAQPPWFEERSLENNFLRVVGSVVSLGALTVRNLVSGIIPGSNRRYLAVELQQDVKDAIVNGKDSQDVTVTIAFTGIQGELRDHVLIVKHAIVTGDQESEGHLQTLQKLVDSFRPVKPVNMEQARKEIVAQADEKFKESVTNKGEQLFLIELRLLSLRLRGIDLDDAETRFYTMKLLKPFEQLARQINLQGIQILDELWAALRRAESGDATEFKTILNELIEVAIGEDEATQSGLASLPNPETILGISGGTSEETSLSESKL